MSEKLTDVPNDEEMAKEQPLSPEEEFENTVCYIRAAEDRFGALSSFSIISNMLAGQQITFAAANVALNGATPFTAGTLGACLAVAGGMKYFCRNEAQITLSKGLFEPVQQKIDARYELYKVDSPEYDKHKPKDDDDNPKHAVDMHYYGAFERQSYTALSDAKRIMTLAKDNKIAKVYMPAVLSAELGIFDETFADTSVHDELNKHINLSKRTTVVDASLKRATPEEWLTAIEKSDAGLGVEGLLQTISDLNPADPLVKIWGVYKELSQSAPTRTALYQTLYKQLRTGFERQLHDTEIDNAQLRAARLTGQTFDKSKAVSHLHGEVRHGKVHWLSQTGQEVDVTSLKAALGLTEFDDRAMQEVLTEPHMNPQLARKAAEFTLFSTVRDYLNKTAKDQSQVQDGREPIAVYDHHNGAIKPLVENIQRTKEHHRGKQLALRLGCTAIGVSIAMVPALLIAQREHNGITEGGLSSGEIGNISGGKNHVSWTLDEHGLEAAGYWGATTGQKLTITKNDGQPVFEWNDVLLNVETTQDLPATLPANISRSIEVGHQMTVGDVVRIQGEDGWSMRVPVRQGLDIVAAAMGSSKLSVQHRGDGTTWLHSNGEAPDTTDKLTYWLAADANAPKPKAFAEAQVEDTITNKNPYPATVMNKHLPKYVQRDDSANNLKQYIQSTWEYDLKPLPALNENAPLESFIVKALAARKANCNVANTLEALYDFDHKRAVASGYYVEATDKAIYSHSAHMWTVDDKGNILDATPYKGADKFNDYFASQNDYWSAERIAQTTMVGSLALGVLAFAAITGRQYARRWRYYAAAGKAQTVHNRLDNDAARRAIATIEQVLYAPSLNLSEARQRAEKSQKTGAYLMAAKNAVILAPETEARIKEIYNETEASADKTALQEVLTTINAARELVAHRQKLYDKATRLHKKLPQDI